MRKLVYGALALSAALTLSVGSVAAEGVDDGQNTPAVAAVSVDGIEGDTLTISATGAKQVLVGTAKEARVRGSSSQTLKVSAWDTYDVTDGKVTVDLSKIATTKDAYLRIKKDGQKTEEGITVKLPKTDVKLKARYDKAKGTITIESGSNTKYNGTVQWRTANSEYSADATATTNADGVVDATSGLGAELERYRMSGGTIYMCVPQQAAAVAAAEGDATAASFVEADGKTAITVQTLGTRRSKEAKVTISKRANAPKISVNYVKGTISIPNKAQYRVTKYNANGAVTGELSNFSATLSSKEELTVAQQAEESNGKIIVADTAFAIDVRIPESDTKAASKVGHTTFGAQAPTEYADSIEVELAAIRNNKDKINIIVKNKSTTETYTFYVGDDTRGVTVKPDREGKLRNVAIAATTKISVQRVGDKTTETWAGNKTAGVDLETFTKKTMDEIKKVAGGDTSTGGEDTPKVKYGVTVEKDATVTNPSFQYKVVTEDGTAIEDLTDVAADTVVYITLSVKNTTNNYKVQVEAGGVTMSEKITTSGTAGIDGKGWNSSYSFTMPKNNVKLKIIDTSE